MRKEDADLFPSITPENERELIELARAASQRQANLQRNSIKSRSSLDTVMDLPQNSPVLDPDDGNFSLHKWLRYMGLNISEESFLDYKGVSPKTMNKHFEGEVLYNQEVDRHFPHLTVGQTLEMAASYRAPAEPWNGMSRDEWASYVTKVTMQDFKKYWESSEDFKALCRGIEEDSKAATDSTLADLEASKHSRQAEHTDPSSPYMIPVTTQVLINTKRAYLRVWQDKASTVTTIIAQVVQALLVGSMFYNTEDATQGFRGKAAVLNFAVVLNAMVAIAEIQSLYSQRPVIEKHKSYAFYRPFTEALAGIVADIPVKFVISVVFNIILYFLANLRREPAQFFIYFLVSYLITMVMTALFRFIAASTKTISSALAMAGVTFLIIIAYTGFSLPVPYM
ncbi:putative abc multidrug protein [Neofusicoccum parvum UCRNP2]|uniref:Putative abc multidrug protein n=1 Tax=Botryosphaeria parva (strain UCR-NP2) TaxID=1287680 RepID=R1E6P8_BOTPV|nr:putative abc multidrug protein [Neofusicoccum parvum UCRNP2]